MNNFTAVWRREEDSNSASFSSSPCWPVVLGGRAPFRASPNLPWERPCRSFWRGFEQIVTISGSCQNLLRRLEADLLALIKNSRQQTNSVTALYWRYLSPATSGPAAIVDSPSRLASAHIVQQRRTPAKALSTYTRAEKSVVLSGSISSRISLQHPTRTGRSPSFAAPGRFLGVRSRSDRSRKQRLKRSSI